MLEDRDYMRESSAGSWWERLPAALWLVIVNVVFYAAQLTLPILTGSAGLPGIRLEHYLALRPDELIHGHVWQLITFQFLHGGLLHLVINCAMLYIFGRPVETAIGRAGFLKLYFSCGVVGGLLQVLVSFAFPAHFGFREGWGWPPVVGASAGVFGLIAAFATLYRDQPITMLLAFILPVSMKAKYLLLVEVILSVLGLLDAGSHVAHAAHLGGMIMGIFYVKQVVHWQLQWPGALRRPVRRVPPRELVNVATARSQRWQKPRPEPSEPASTEEFLSREVDPILDKISAHGIHSLTERERKILEAARKRMDKR